MQGRCLLPTSGNGSQKRFDHLAMSGDHRARRYYIFPFFWTNFSHCTFLGKYDPAMTVYLRRPMLELNRPV